MWKKKKNNEKFFKNKQEMQYLDLLDETMKKIKKWKLKLKEDRTWTWTYSEVGWQMIFDLNEWFPLLTSKKVFYKWIIHELLWFIRWDTNIKYLEDNWVRIWREWAYKNYVEEMKENWEEPVNIEEFAKLIVENDFYKKKWRKNLYFWDYFWELWPVYWKQWRDFNWIDQLKNAIETLKNNPNSRRIIVSSWNPEEIEEMSLPPCHTLYQFIVNEWELSLHLYQRSADMFLWVPFNIASYALLIHIIAKLTWLKVWKFVHSFWDRHIYSDHLDQVNEQLSRKKKLYKFPELEIEDRWQKELEDFVFEDFKIINYKSHDTIKANVSI